MARLELVLVVFVIAAVVWMGRSGLSFGDDSKVDLNQLKFNFTEIKGPKDLRLSPIIAYDHGRNALWMGDITMNSGKLIEFDMNKNKFIPYDVPGTNFLTHIGVGRNGILWCTDPNNGTLVRFDPRDGNTKIFTIPSIGNPSDMIVDTEGNPWISIAEPSQILKFDTIKENFTAIKMSATSSAPFALTSDSKSGEVWAAEGLGQIARIDPVTGKFTNYGPSYLSFAFPVGIAVDPKTGLVYFSEHNGYDVKVFDPKEKTFKKYDVNFGGFPSGIVLDDHSNLWVSQHTLDKLAVIDTLTGKTIQVDIPQKSLVQKLAKDSNGDILFVDLNNNSVGIITSHTAVPEFPYAWIVLTFALIVPIIFYRKTVLQSSSIQI